MTRLWRIPPRILAAFGLECAAGCSGEADGGFGRSGDGAARLAARQLDAQQQAVRRPVLRPDRAAERLDVAARDPQPDPEMRHRRIVRRRLAGALREVAAEDPREILLWHARPGIADQEDDDVARGFEADADLRIVGREGDRIVEDVLDHRLDHLLVGEGDDAGRDASLEDDSALAEG